MENFMKIVKLGECGLSYGVVSIMGPQSSVFLAILKGERQIILCHYGSSVAEMRMLRWMSGFTNRDRIRNEHIREKLVQTDCHSLLEQPGSKTSEDFIVRFDKTLDHGQAFAANAKDISDLIMSTFDESYKDAGIEQVVGILNEWEMLWRNINAYATSVRPTKLYELMSLYEETYKRKNIQLSHPWAIATMLNFGFNELMKILRNPLYLWVIYVAFLWLKRSMSNLKFQLFGIILSSTKFLSTLMSLLKKRAHMGQKLAAPDTF